MSNLSPKKKYNERASMVAHSILYERVSVFATRCKRSNHVTMQSYVDLYGEMYQNLLQFGQVCEVT
jgi:hypothetical protein